MSTTTDRIKKIRKRTLIITIIDFLVIFLVVFYISNYILVEKSFEVGDTKIKLKYMRLKEDLGFILNLNIIPSKKREIILGNEGAIKFFIRKGKQDLWLKEVLPQKKASDIIQNKEVKRKNKFILNKNESLSFNAIYDNYENGLLDDGIYQFGANLVINSSNVIVTIPVKIKDGKDKKIF